MNKKKAIILTAFLGSLLIFSVLASHFLVLSSPSGKYIHVEFTCLQSGKPIVGLPVTIGDTMIKTNATGEAVFGSGYPAGTYTIEWTWWDGPHSDTVTIDCTQKDWYYYYELPNPKVGKTFRVDTPHNGYPPIEGLEVTLKGVALTETQFGTTNVDGYVEFILEYPFHDYTLMWTWNGKDASEPVLWTDFVEGIWTKTNSLVPKGG